MFPISCVMLTKLSENTVKYSPVITLADTALQSSAFDVAAPGGEGAEHYATWRTPPLRGPTSQVMLNCTDVTSYEFRKVNCGLTPDAVDEVTTSAT